ncbi:RAD51-associated protein 1 isoform X3 [Notolabrus celidotus]|uniref:RAD51-associated protein 1 isoform X3 n=1 Tax=Notolabrus celidotus TaxID=1203425 RepID=UPI00148F4562|nr:RAD51-associated protein 1 isoform X3 [Notolabrus celidotus]
MDRPARKTKAVSYLEANDFDEDEDFACAKAPPSKKAREDAKQEHKRSLSRSSSQGSNSQTSTSQKIRPLDERVQDRDLEAAIALSLLNNSDEQTNQSPPATGGVMAQVPVDENTDPTFLHFSNCSVDLTALGLEEITSEKQTLPPSRQRKATTEELRKKASDEEDEYEPTLSPESQSDDDFSAPSESEDEEFTVKKSSKAKKQKGTKEKTKPPPPATKKEKQPSKPSKPKPQAAAASTPVRSPPVAKLAPKRPASAMVVPKSKPAVSVSPAGGRVPKWNPPGQVGKSSSSSQSPSGRSPAQGLRLGLSRMVRVKPLHPSVTSH